MPTPVARTEIITDEYHHELTLQLLRYPCFCYIETEDIGYSCLKFSGYFLLDCNQRLQFYRFWGFFSSYSDHDNYFALKFDLYRRVITCCRAKRCRCVAPVNNAGQCTHCVGAYNTEPRQYWKCLKKTKHRP